MVDILAEDLSGKGIIMGGTELGVLYNITMDLKTGRLSDLLVTPSEAQTVEGLPFEADGDGHVKVPVRRVQRVEDYIQIEPV
ncbi:PRC-barrel domain-containing protein [Halobaculum sp. MBLA0147]|uniref:PRC-barrel domain-containing protein n=1 Tax=Halobaculum sp. MBLA0147 TaxID=3079934 RepID=UPI003525E1AE